MSEFVNLGDSVEGAKCSIYTRKYNHKGLREDPILHKPVSVYELSLNCSVEVTHVLTLPDAALEYRRQCNIHLDKGDKLKAASITLYVDDIRRMRFEVKEGMSGRHGGQIGDTHKRALGTIKHPFENIKRCFDIQPIIKEIPSQL